MKAGKRRNQSGTTNPVIASGIDAHLIEVNFVVKVAKPVCAL
jgi:hypothetical protein